MRDTLRDASGGPDLVPQQRWRWTKIHNVSLVRYMGRTAGGLRLLREELEAENDGTYPR